jgi:type I restriction enzyme S subunit
MSFGRAFITLIDGYIHDGWLRLRNDEKFVDKEWLYYYLSSDNAQIQFRAIAGGSVVSNLKSDTVKAITLTLPSLAEQRRVAGILGSLDEKIENNRRLIRTTEALARTLFKKHIVSNEESEGWENSTLGEICDIKIGRTPPRKETQWFSKESGKMWVSIKDMGLAGQYISDSSEYLANGSESKFNIPLIKTGTLILSFKLTVGKLCFVTKDCYSNEAIAQLPIKDTRKMSKEFLYSYLSGFDFDSLGNTSSIGTAVNSTTIKNLEIKLPPAAVLQTFNAAVEPLFAEIDFLTRENQTLAAARGKLLRKLIK